MDAADDMNSEPTLKFKRRKIAHTKRARLDDAPTPESSDAAIPIDAASPPPAHEEDETALNLKEILRARKRPRDRLREAAARKTETKSQELVLSDAPQQGAYTDRFVAQTGQVVDRDDKQLTEYIEARMAEKNHRLYGWPVPKHLEGTVAALVPEVEQTTPVAHHGLSTKDSIDIREGAVTTDQSSRLAAGLGKLHEVDLGPDAAARNLQRTEAARRRLEGGQYEEEQPARKVRLGRDGKPRRQPKRRNSEDVRRDQMVEAVLREAKLDYFEEDIPPSPPPAGNTDNDDAMVEKFRLDFLESLESRQQRKPALPLGTKEGPKGPKMGGSRSARAAMRLQEEQAAKNKRGYKVNDGRLLEPDDWQAMSVKKSAWYMDTKKG